MRITTGKYRSRILCLILLVFFFFSCNSVKQVLLHPEKFEQVAKEVVKRGYCVNDTTRSDTTTRVITKDSLVYDTVVTSIPNGSSNYTIDTTFSSGSKLRIDTSGNIFLSCPVKIIEKKIDVQHFIRDRKKEQILQEEIDGKNDFINALNTQKLQLLSLFDQKEQQLKALQRKIRQRTIQLIGLLALIACYLGFSALRKLKSILPI